MRSKSKLRLEFAHHLTGDMINLQSTNRRQCGSLQVKMQLEDFTDETIPTAPRSG